MRHKGNAAEDAITHPIVVCPFGLVPCHSTANQISPSDSLTVGSPAFWYARKPPGTLVTF